MFVSPTNLGKFDKKFKLTFAASLASSFLLSLWKAETSFLTLELSREWSGKGRNSESLISSSCLDDGGCELGLEGVALELSSSSSSSPPSIGLFRLSNSALTIINLKELLTNLK